MQIKTNTRAVNQSCESLPNTNSVFTCLGRFKAATVTSASAAELRSPQAEKSEHPPETEPSDPKPARAGVLKETLMSDFDEGAIGH